MKNLTAFALFFIIVSSVAAQQTVGLFHYSTDAAEGYTLFSPIRSKESFLINNCGEKVHNWPSAYFPAASSYLMENGVLLRTGNTFNTTFAAGGAPGGRIEMIDWSGNLIWEFTLSNDSACLHHDIEYLPNGNILAIVWDLYSPHDAMVAGRTVVGNSVWSEKIIEIQPNLLTGGSTIVWEWKVWDHLIQEENATSDNFGIVGNELGKIDLNYPEGADGLVEDWLHFNGIDYNPDLDQIILSVHRFNEIWIIDHSTTTVEASGNVGGNSGLGGELLFRWGNPQTYDAGSPGEQVLFSQHHAHWIKPGMEDEGKIMVFNNKAGQAQGQDFSTVDIIAPVLDAFGAYERVGGVYSPASFDWTYAAPIPTDFYANIISGAERLENGNTLITEGTSGTFFEIDSAKNIVWEYVNPASQSIASQGQAPGANIVFRAKKYPLSYPAFVGKDLTPHGPIESGSTYICSLLAVNEANKDEQNSIVPNPTSDFFYLKSTVELNKLSIFNIKGECVKDVEMNSKEAFVDCSELANGVYYVNSYLTNGQVQNTKLVIAH